MLSMSNVNWRFVYPETTPQIWLMAGIVVSIMMVTGNSQNSMNKKWKLAFTPCLAGPLSLLFSHFPFARWTIAKLVRRGRRSSLSAGKKRNQKVGKNLILKNCHSVSIWKFQGYQLPPTSVFFTPSSAFASRISRFSSPSPPPHLHLYGGRLSTGCSYCLARSAANRQIRLKDIDLATRAWNVLVRLRRAPTGDIYCLTLYRGSCNN